MVAATAAAAGQQQGEGRPAMNVPRPVLDAFERLVLNDEKKRTAAGMVILRHVELILKGGLQGKELPAGVRYILQRLVSGLASNRLSAREGYYSTLCLLLRLHPSSFKPSVILSLLNSKKSATMKAFTKDDIRDQLMSELLLCGALVRSGQVRRSPEVLQFVVNHLCALRAKKSYLDITATQFLVNLIEGCEGGSMLQGVWQSLHTELQGPVAELSPSQLWLRLALLKKHRKDPPVWLTSTLTPKNHEALRETIMKAVTSLPEVHPVLPELVSTLAASSTSLLIKFWGVILEPLQSLATPGKLQILFHLLKFIIPHLRTVENFKTVVTSSVVGLLLSSLTQSVRDLKQAAMGVTAALIQLVEDNQEEDNELQLTVVQALVTPPGSVRFDQLTGHKVLSVMMPSFTFNTLKGFASTLLEVFNKPKMAKDSGVADRKYAAHMLGNLLGQPRAVKEGGKWRLQQLAVLLRAGLLMPREEEEGGGDAIKDVFFKALGKHVGHIKEYKDILLGLVEEVEKELKAAEKAGSGIGSSPSPLDDKGREQWSKVYSRLTRLKKEHKEDTEQDVAKTIFQVLYCQMALHLFVDVKVATESIDEFITCYKEVKKLGMFSEEEEEESEEEEEEEEEEEGVEGKPSWVEVVTEMLLTLMTQEVHLIRCVVQGVFWLLMPLMTPMALSLLTDVLDTDKARELLKKEGEEDSEEDEDDDDEEEEKDNENEDEKSSGEEDSDDEEDEEPGEDDDPNLFTLRKKMLSAAGGIDVDVDMDSVPQEELDRLDERLGALLAEYKGKKKGKRKGKKGGGDNEQQLSQDELSIMHFQTRVCDMLMLYIKAAPNMALQVGLVIPVIKAVRVADYDSRQKDLQRKLGNVVNVLKKKKKFSTFGDITITSWKETVDEFFSFACQLPDRFVSVIQSCYSQLMYCGRLLLGQTEGAALKPDNFLTLTYASHLKKFFSETHQLVKVQPFTEPCTYNMGGLWQVAATLLHAAFDPSKKTHKQSQAIMALQKLYTNKALVAERSREEVVSLEQDLYIKVTETLDSMQRPISVLHAGAVFSLLRCLVQMEKCSESKSRLDWNALHKHVEAFRGRITKKELKGFALEYGTFCRILKELLSSKGQKRKEGVKRKAEETNKEEIQEEQVKKKKKEDKSSSSSSLVMTNTVPNAVEGEKKSKKKKKNKQMPHKEEIGELKNTEEIHSKNSVVEIKEEESEDEIMVINGTDEIQCLGEVPAEQSTTKKKKKDKLADTQTATTEESTDVTDQDGSPKKKKKKKKNKLTNEVGIPSDSLQEEDNPSEERKTESKKKKKKNKSNEDQEVIDINTESQDTQNEDRLEEVTVIKKKKKKKKQKDESDEGMTEKGEKRESVPASSPLTLDPPTKKKKKKHAIQVNGGV